MKIVVACDQGTHSTAPVDHPDCAERLAQAGRDRRAERGVLNCGSGLGASVAARYSAGERHARRLAKVVARESRYR